MEIDPTVCNKCNKRFSRKSTCVRHVRNGKCGGLKKTPSIKREFICDYCKKSFTLKRSCAEHIVKRICFNAFEKKGHPEAQILKFENSAEFLIWKDCEEQRTHCKYSQNIGCWKTASWKKIKYCCHRSGNIRNRCENPELRKRALKRKGSCKINNRCTAYMLYKEWVNGKVTVEYYPKHSNHEIEIKHLPLSSIEKEKIADKLKEGVPLDRILDDIRDTLNGSSFTRSHLLIKHDLHNIMAKYGIAYKERLASIDAVSVELLMEQYSEKLNVNTPFKYYKEQGIEKDNFQKDDFLLVIMTSSQIDMMKKFGNSKICIDSMDSTNQHDLLLTTIVIMNDIDDMGVPVAHLISNRKTTKTMRKFFSVVKHECGICSMETAVFMTDDFPAYLNAWTAVMGKPKKNLLCTWHVDKSWQENLTLVKGSAAVKDHVYKLVKTVMEEKDEKLFPEIIDSMITDLLNYEETADFGKYFQKEYGKRYKLWAFAFRKYIGQDANMKLEEMHQELNSVYFNGIQNKRLDSLITDLLKMNHNKAFDRISHAVMDTDSHTYQKLRDRHVSGVAISQEDITIISDNIGAVISQRNRSYYYTVEKIKDECDCRLRCEDCGGICVHMYDCTCDDYTIGFNLCKHIHAFVLIRLPVLCVEEFCVEELCIENINNNVNEEVQPIFQVTQPQYASERNKETCLRDSMKIINQQIQGYLERNNGIPGEEEIRALSLMKQAAEILKKRDRNAQS